LASKNKIIDSAYFEEYLWFFQDEKMNRVIFRSFWKKLGFMLRGWSVGDKG